jgi:hypothetical protein
MAVSVMEQLIEFGEVRRGFLGIQMDTVTQDFANEYGLTVNSGALVTVVLEGSAAEAAGIQIDDVLVGINGASIASGNELRNRVGLMRPGDEVQIALDFDGIGYAVDAGNAGIVVIGFSVFFRVSELDDSVDHNFDGDLNDVVLMRNPTSQCGPVFMSTASHHAGPVVFSEGGLSAAMFADETQVGKDFNGDGDAGDVFVVRYFEL